MSLIAKVLRRISWREGVKSGLRTTWELGKIIFPVTLVVSLLQYTALYDVLLSGLTPVMGLIGLPNEAAVPLALGNLLNLYAAIGAMLTMDLTVKQVFILALMLSFSHSLPVESAVCRRIGVSVTLVFLFRIILAGSAAFAIGSLWSGGDEIARYGIAAASGEEPSGWIEVVLHALRAAGTGIVELAVIVFPVMMGIQILKNLGVLEKFAGLMRPLMGPLGIAPRGAVTMAGGLVFGLAFGAGVIIQQVREQEFTRRELTLMILFLCACHAVIEDTLIFVPLGIDVLPLLLIRLVTAVILTLLIARL
ncbi:MAG TPA: nucleoside recognition domain-containing protein [Rubrobacteraceae bacterium]|nr:nucleoside recognition domain-containing protein [Rubrobacteraceae bacterium]